MQLQTDIIYLRCTMCPVSSVNRVRHVSTAYAVFATSILRDRHKLAKDAKEVAGYALSLLRPGCDAAVLPSDSSTRDFADFCKETLGIQDPQLIWVDHNQTCYVTAKDLNAGTAGQIKEFVQQQQQQRLLLENDKQQGTVPPNPQGMPVVPKNQPTSSRKCTLIPYGVTPALQQWMAQQQVALPLLCDDVRLGHKGFMHRHIRHMDKPSKVETLNPKISVAEGYSCSTVDDLLVAFRLLGGREAVVKPLYGKEGTGVLLVSSPEELRLYDFPLGDVVLEKALLMDKGEDGVAMSLSHVTMGQTVLGAFEKVCVGTVKFGTRSTQVSAEFEAITQSWTSQIASLLVPEGPGYLHYVSLSGSPVLLGFRLGQLSTEHFAAMFLQRHAPGASFYCWTAPLPQRSIDVWTFWARLLEHGAAFSPATSPPAGSGNGSAAAAMPSGVWPLLFLKGNVATLLAIGQDREQVAHLRQLADACVREPVPEQPELELTSWREDVRRIWASGPRPEYRRQTQRYNLSNRCIPLVRKGLDVIILPGGHEGTRDFASFCKDVLNLADEQIIFTSGSHYNLDDDVDDSIVSRLKAMLVSNTTDRFTLVPYAVTPNFQRWANELSEFSVSVFGESLEWIQQYGHKGILHRSMASPEQPSVIEQINPKIPVAHGYYCETREQLLAAYKLMGVKDVVLKPVFGAAGEGILFIHDEMELALYDFPMGGVCLEELLQLDRAADGIVLSPAVHYMEGKLVGQGLVDQIMVGTSYSGWRPSVVNKSFAHTAIKVTHDILTAIKPKGPGGFDFLSVGGKPVLTDVNTGRFNGAHSPKLFVELYAPQQKFYVWKQKPPERLTVWQFWQRLQDAGVAFWPGRNHSRGVFPMIFLPGLSGQFIAIADTEAAAQDLRPLAENCLKVPVRIRQPAITQKYSVFKRADIVNKANYRRIWCLSPLNSKFISSFTVNQLTPLHAVTLLRPELDVIVLPNRPDVREFFRFVKATTGLDDSQVVWTSGRTNCLHTDIDTEAVDQLKALVTIQQDSTAAAVVTAAGDSQRQDPGAFSAGANSNTQQQTSSRMERLANSAAAADAALQQSIASRTSSWLSPSVHVAAGGQAPPSGNHSNGKAQSSTGAPTAGGPSAPTRRPSFGASSTSSSISSTTGGSNSSCGWIIIPDTPSSSFQKWAGPLIDHGVRVFADLPLWMSQYGNKGILHKHISQVPAAASATISSNDATQAGPASAAAANRAPSVAASISTTLASELAAIDGNTPQGDSPTTAAASAHSSTPFNPADSALEDLQELVYVPKGYICSSTQDLHKAYNLLFEQTASSRVSLKPVRAGASPGEGSLKCASKQELAYYDFPLGDVIMQEDIALDSAPDGLLLLPRLPYLAGDRLGNTVVDMLLVGDQIAGYRPSCLSDEMQQQLAEVSARFLSKVNPKGAGALSFGLSQGRLVLLGAQMGTFTPEHFLKMFLERWTEVEDCTYFCWQHVPPKSVDVWQFWARLIETGVAFKPGSSTSGVYPLVYLPGVIGTFIAISSEDTSDSSASSHLEDLRAAAIAALTAPAAAAGTALLHATGWSPDDRRVFVTGASRDLHQQQLRFVLPIRSLCLARKCLDVVVLPGGHEPTSEFATWASRQLGLQPDQLLFTSGHSYALDEDIGTDVISELKQLLVTSEGPWTLVPLRPTSSFYTWARPLHELNVKVLAASEGGRYSSKAVLYRRAAAPDVPSVIEQIDPEIRVAHGYICSSSADLVTAYKLLSNTAQQLYNRDHPVSHNQRHGLGPSGLHTASSSPVLLKPLSGGGDGEGLLVVSDEEQLMLYDFAEGQDVVLQELLVLDRAPDGMVLSLAVPFADGHVLGSYAMDEILVGQAAVGFRPTEAPKRLKQKALSISQVLVQELSEVLMGTLYFASVDGEPVLMGYDPTECSGIHLVRLFLQQHAPAGSCFYSWRFKPPAGVGIDKFWDVLRSKGLAYELGSGKRKGVFPLYYLRGLEVMLVAFGASALDCCLLQDKARQSIDRAFRRPLAKASAAGARGSSPQPTPPLDGSSALQPPALGLGPPASALRGAARAQNTPWDLGNGNAGCLGGSAGSSPAGSVSGLSPSSSLVGPAAAGSLLGSALSSSFPYSSARAQIAAHAASLSQSNIEVDRSQAGDPKQMAMTLLLGAEAVYGPSLLEERNILLAGGRIIAILDDETADGLRSSLPAVAVLDCKGCIITPGFVDCHVHITGGGGEAGPASRCPPSRLSEFIDAGITCVVGLLGTDDVSRSNEELIIKAQALNEEGMTAYTWIGSYHAPPATVTCSIRRDMCLVQSAIGVGELAVADHRGSQLCAAEVAKIAAEARVGGMLSGKAGIVHIHVGPGASGLQVLREAVAGSDIPLTQFHPTHMDRSEDLINQGAKWLLDGGSLDFTVRSIRARRALQQYHQSNVPLHSVTVSSDAFGSLPSYDSDGRLVSYTVADAKALLRALRNMYFQDHWPLERILPLMTSNPARVLKLKHKGRIAVGADADLLVFSHATLQLKWVYAKGVMRKCPQWTQGGFFEKGSKIKPYRAAAGKDDDDGM